MELLVKIILTLTACQVAMSVTIERMTPAVEHGEGPHWDARTQKLYFVDISGQNINRLDPVTQKVTSVHLNCGPVGAAVPVEGTTDKIVAGCGRDTVIVTWNGEYDCPDPVIEKIAALDTDKNNTRVNDGKCDPAGRFWIGTMGPEVNNVVDPNRGSLYVVNNDQEAKKVVSPVTVSNGLAWNSQKDTMYYIDTPTLQIQAFDYNNFDGSISNKRVVFDIQKNNVNGLPDGMAIDANDDLWVALYNGGAVIQVDPRIGRLIRTIKLPVDKTTSVAFGGPQMDTLYVTSSRVGLSKEQIRIKPESGSVFVIKELGVHGRPSNSFKYNI